jgi:hypothetical protein
MEEESPLELIPILMEDEDENPFAEFHGQVMLHKDVGFTNVLGESTLEFNNENQVDDHISYILEEPPYPQFYEKLLESFFPTFASIYERCNNPMSLLQQTFEKDGYG